MTKFRKGAARLRPKLVLSSVDADWALLVCARNSSFLRLMQIGRCSSASRVAQGRDKRGPYETFQSSVQ
jgi:hypothetical protein